MAESSHKSEDAGSDSDTEISDGPTGGHAAGTGGDVPSYKREEFQDSKYKMKSGERVLAIIFNNEKFDHKKTRTGTDNDAVKINRRFRDLGFKVENHNNKTSSEMQSVINEAADRDFLYYDCLACVILSYGEEGLVYGTDGPVQIEHFVDPFKRNKSLAGKPKLFFIQACDKEEPELLVDETGARVIVGGYDEEFIPVTHRIPAAADFFIAYSVVPGYYSWKGNRSNGSWFIGALSDVLEKFGTSLDLMTMMIRVNKQVAHDFEINNSHEFNERKKQIPCITSMLTKEVRFPSA